MSWGGWPSTVQPTLCAVPRISLAPPARSFASDFDRIVRAMSNTSSRVMLPLCLMFFSFLRSRGGSVPKPQYKISRDILRKRTLEGLDDQGGGGGNDGNLCLTVLDRKLDGHTQTLPCTSRLCDIFSDLLR